LKLGAQALGRARRRGLDQVPVQRYLLIGAGVTASHRSSSLESTSVLAQKIVLETNERAVLKMGNRLTRRWQEDA
jgi:hypothetical protein